MKKNENQNNYLGFLYRAGLAWANIFIFMKLVSLAANFARIYTNVYGSGVSHFLIILFAVTFFLLFRNLTLLAVSIPNNDTDSLNKMFKNIGVVTTLILVALLTLQTVPEFLLTLSFQNQ